MLAPAPPRWATAGRGPPARRQAQDTVEAAVGEVAADGAVAPDGDPHRLHGVDRHAVRAAVVHGDEGFRCPERARRVVDGIAPHEPAGAVGQVEVTAVGGEGGTVGHRDALQGAMDRAVVVDPVEGARVRVGVVGHAARPEAAVGSGRGVVHAHAPALGACQPVDRAVGGQQTDDGARRGNPVTGAAGHGGHGAQRKGQFCQGVHGSRRVVEGGEKASGEKVDQDGPAVGVTEALPQFEPVGTRGPQFCRHWTASLTAAWKARARSRKAVRLPPSAASPTRGEPTPTAVAPAAG